MSTRVAILTSGTRRPPKPSREDLLTIQASFCSHEVTLDGYGTIPCFDPFIASMTPTQRQQVYRRKHALKLRHIVLSANYSYADDGGYTYPVPGHDWRHDLPGLAAIVAEAVDAGFLIVLTLTNGGQEDWLYWFGNDAARLKAAAPVFNDTADWTVYSILWEVIGPGGDWSPDQVQMACYQHRQAFGVENQIAVEFGQGYCHLGGGGEDWYRYGLIQVDLFLYEAQQETFEPSAQDKNLDCYSRMLGPAATNIPPVNQGPWYVGASRPRGPLFFCQFENCAYIFIRGWIDATGVQTNARWYADHGATSFGNGLP